MDRASATRILAPLLCLALVAALPDELGDVVKAREIHPAEGNTYIDSSPGVQTGSLINCARFRVLAIPRLRNFQKAAHVVRIHAAAAPLPTLQFSAPKIQVCFHQNSSLDLCQCPKDSWKSLEKGRLSTLKSPFQTKYVDVRAIGSITDIPVVVSFKQEFCLYRAVFFMLGVALLLVAPIVSKWVPFYYSSAMTLGILLVVLIVLFQAMKLLPTGRKSSLYIIMYGSMVGFGTLVVRYVASLLTPLFVQLGLGEDMLKPVAIFSLLGVAIMGAWLGYWGVRKFVLTCDGDVDSGTSDFVKWSLRLVGAILLLQSSYDPVFQLLSLVVGVSISQMGHLTVYLPFEDFSWPLFGGGSGTFDSLRYRRKQTKLWRKKLAAGSPHASSSYRTPVSVSGKRVFVSPPARFKFTPESDYYSTFHKTPERGMSKTQYNSISRECTLQCMQELVASPEFANWANENAGRISVLPNEEMEERSHAEIQRTATMDTDSIHTLRRY